MPSYEYELIDGETGRVLVCLPVLVPVAKRDAVRLRRRTVPRTVTIAGAATAPDDAQQCTMKGYHRQEEKLGSRFKSAYSADEVKRSFKIKPATPAGGNN